MMNDQECESLEDLYKYAKEAIAGREKHEEAYLHARGMVIEYRKILPSLPKAPDHNQIPLAGLQDIMEWCVTAGTVVDALTDRFDPQVIQGYIDLLGEYHQLECPRPSNKSFKEARVRALAILKRIRRRPRPPRYIHTYHHRGPDRSFELACIVGELASLGWESRPGSRRHLEELRDRISKVINGYDTHLKAFVERTPSERKILRVSRWIEFWRIAERICRVQDKAYAKQFEIFEEARCQWSRRADTLSQTVTGKLLVPYDKLKGLGLCYQIDDLGGYFGESALIDLMIFTPKIEATLVAVELHWLEMPVEKVIGDLTWRLKAVLEKLRPITVNRQNEADLAKVTGGQDNQTHQGSNTRTEKPTEGVGKKRAKENIQTPPEGEWSKPMSKSRMMKALGIDSEKTFNSFAKRHGLDEINRKTFRLRLDGLSVTERKKLENA